jgi:ubiquinol-cytochrome c reductase cytochrome b subunit
VTGYAVLLMAGGQDVLAFKFDVSVNGLNWVFRIALFVLPALAFWLTRWLCLALQDRDREHFGSGVPTGFVRQSAGGGFSQEHRTLTVHQKYPLTIDRAPDPLEAADGSRRERLRAALSGWYYRDRVR